MAINDRSYPFDASLLLSDGVNAITASGYAQNNATDGILDLGGNQASSPVQQARIDAVAVVDVVSIDTASGDEDYILMIVGSNDANFGAGNVACLAAMELGTANGKKMANGAADTAGRYELFFSTQQNGTYYQYVKHYVYVAGTTPSIKFQTYVAVLPEP